MNLETSEIHKSSLNIWFGKDLPLKMKAVITSKMAYKALMFVLLSYNSAENMNLIEQ